MLLCRVVTSGLRLTLPDALQRVASETEVDLRHAAARVGIGRGHLLEIVVQSGDFAVADEPGALLACERLVELLLGHQTYQDWIGTIRTVPGPKAHSLRMASSEPEVFHPLYTLVPAVDAGRSGILAGLDERPYHAFCEHAAWTLLDVEPELSSPQLSSPQQHDVESQDLDPHRGACLSQDDLVLCSTMLPEMMKCFLQKDRFSSQRFSRHGELFLYLKYRDMNPTSSEQRLAERARLEDALNRALVPGAVGCVVGAGLGLCHGYVDVALSDLEHGVVLIRRVWRSAGPVGAAWLQFCDSSRQHEWIAVSESAPIPPGGKREIMAQSLAKGAQPS